MDDDVVREHGLHPDSGRPKVEEMKERKSVTED